MSKFKIGDKVKEINYNPKVRFKDYPNLVIPEIKDGIVTDIRDGYVWVKQDKKVIGFKEDNLVKVDGEVNMLFNKNDELMHCNNCHTKLFSNMEIEYSEHLTEIYCCPDCATNRYYDYMRSKSINESDYENLGIKTKEISK